MKKLINCVRVVMGHLGWYIGCKRDRLINGKRRDNAQRDLPCSISGKVTERRLITVHGGAARLADVNTCRGNCAVNKTALNIVTQGDTYTYIATVLHHVRDIGN